ncbi:iron-containing alcohol dehydrogenase [Cetobacterium somerae]|uniref:1-propanol dehydrogenase PduQ n=1 Tax=Cetobacterium TaxID=180162 RepID=UPI00225711D2|nr:1-propanol dehydrogenase PduQ [Cetobacterium somerae]MCX3066830.1 iron-containing alcohol dehydrogenase [Cetobacterium somerae]
MKRFNIETAIYFGEGSLEKLRELDNKKILIVCDKFIGTSDILKKVLDKLEKCEVLVFDEIVPDPTIKIVAKGVQLLKREKFDLIIALGGGSSIDGAKAIREYYKRIDENVEIDFYAIPTTSGTGSEVTEYSVITNEKESLKYALTNEDLLPTIAILDPELVKSVPKSITADTGMDVLTHAIEAYVSKEASDFTDALAEKAFELVVKNLEKVYENGNDIYAREKMHNASCLAGIAFNAAGLGLTHSLAHMIGGRFHIPHGKINAIILPYVIKFNSDIDRKSYLDSENEILKRYQKLGKIAGLNGINPVIGTSNLINYIQRLQKSVGIPKNLKELKIDGSSLLQDVEVVYEIVMKDICTKTNPKEIKKEDIKTLLKDIVG